MRRLLALIALAGAAYALVRRALRRRPPEPGAGEEAVSDPADELRRKLAAQRAGAGPQDASGDAPPDEPVSDRRAGVHVRAQDAIDRMRDSVPPA